MQPHGQAELDRATQKGEVDLDCWVVSASAGKKGTGGIVFPRTNVMAVA